MINWMWPSIGPCLPRNTLGLASWCGELSLDLAWCRPCLIRRNLSSSSSSDRQARLRRGAGYETIMMNSNPETVSTDYDTSSRLYFEPLTIEDVLNVIEAERPDGIIVQFGGQTPLKLAAGLQTALRENPIPAASGASLCNVLVPTACSCPS